MTLSYWWCHEFEDYRILSVGVLFIVGTLVGIIMEMEGVVKISGFGVGVQFVLIPLCLWLLIVCYL
tara:strand:- start:286 stop:483 length:198 start_codon:yes stop_codon:yes gene_type:complete